jgi:hypothetical protein
VQYTASDLAQQLATGRRIREDGFFSTSGGDRAPMEEVAEAVMRSAQDAFEEQKLPFLGTLLSEILLRPEVDRAAAVQLTREANDITYRQILLLALFGRGAEFNLRADNYRLTPLSNVDPIVPILAEAADLSRRHLVGISGDTILGLTNVIPSAMEPAGMGVWLYNLMRLGELPTRDLTSIALILRDESLDR